MVFQETVFHFVMISLASGLSIKFDSRNPVVEIDKNISIQWNISRADRGSIKFIAIYINEIRDKKKQIVASENSRLFKTGYAKDKYGDRLKTDFIDNQITLNIANAEYEDSGNYLLEIQLKTKEDTNSAVTLKVHGPPHLCMGNFTNETQLSYTVCGFPMPTVTWRSTENITDGLINGTTKNDTYYAHKYLLFVTPDMCGVLYLKAVGYKNKTISWRKNMKNCNNPRTEDSSKTHTITIVAVLIAIFLVAVVVVAFVYQTKFKKNEERQVGSSWERSIPNNNEEENLTEER